MAYCAQSNIEDVFGIENIKQWSNLEAADVTDTSRVARAIVVSDATIEAVARKNNLKIPLQNSYGSTPPLVIDLSATLAGIWLYESRGVQDYHPQTGAALHRLEFKRDAARQMLADIAENRIIIDALRE